MEFTITRTVKAPPEYVSAWWLENGPGHGPTPPTIERKVIPLPSGQTRYVTEGRLGSRAVRQDGVLTREGPNRWRYRSEVWANSRLIAREDSNTSVVGAIGESELSATFRFEPLGRLRQFLLWTGGRTLRRRREEAFDQFVATLERAYANDARNSSVA